MTKVGEQRRKQQKENLQGHRTGFWVILEANSVEKQAYKGCKMYKFKCVRFNEHLLSF